MNPNPPSTRIVSNETALDPREYEVARPSGRMLPLALILLALAGCQGTADGVPDAEKPELAEVLEAYVAEGRTPGVAAAVVEEGEVEVEFAGRTGLPGGSSPSEETLFEIGSITKVFTALLLVEMVQRGEVSLETTVGELHPSPEELGPRVGSISLQELATHTSGLPRLAMTRAQVGRLLLRPGDPYRGATREEIFEAVAEMDGDDLEGRGSFAYSNLGPALLGRFLANAAGAPYEALLRERILEPMGLLETRFTSEVVGGGDRALLARPHRANRRAARNWVLDAYAPAGGLVSSLGDMVRFLERVMAREDEVLTRSLQVVRAGEEGEPHLALGWISRELNGSRYVGHNGRTGGYYAFLGFVPDHSRGVVVLTNSSHGGDALGQALLRGDARVPPADRSWGEIGFTLILLALALWTALQRRRELKASLEGRAHKARGRAYLISGVGEVGLVLFLAWVVGAWQWIPELAWWLALAGSAAFLAASLPFAARLPWFPEPSFPRRALPVLGLTVSCALILWVSLAL